VLADVLRPRVALRIADRLEVTERPPAGLLPPQVSVYAVDPLRQLVEKLALAVGGLVPSIDQASALLREAALGGQLTP
jgi:hypothetical protein